MKVRNLISLIYNNACNENTEVVFDEENRSSTYELEGTWTSRITRAYYSRTVNVLILTNRNISVNGYNNDYQVDDFKLICRED